MKYLAIFLLLAGGCQKWSSNSTDKEKFSDLNLTGTSGFKAAFPIIRDRCIGCHEGYHDNWAKYTNEKDWITNGLVTPRDPDNSQFITKIWNHGTNDSNMPKDGPPLPNDEYQTLIDWVNNIP